MCYAKLCQACSLSWRNTPALVINQNVYWSGECFLLAGGVLRGAGCHRRCIRFDNICIPLVLYTVLSTRTRLLNIYFRSTLDTSHLVSSAHNFKDKLLARQVEMRELIRWSITVVISTISPVEWPNRNGGMLHKSNLYWSCTALLIALQYVGINNRREMCVTFSRISIQWNIYV